MFSLVRIFVTPRTAVGQAPLSTGILQASHWSGLPCPLPGDLPNSGMEPTSLMSPALALTPPGKAIAVIPWSRGFFSPVSQSSSIEVIAQHGG